MIIKCLLKYSSVTKTFFPKLGNLFMKILLKSPSHKNPERKTRKVNPKSKIKIHKLNFRQHLFNPILFRLLSISILLFSSKNSRRGKKSPKNKNPRQRPNLVLETQAYKNIQLKNLPDCKSLLHKEHHFHPLP